MYYSANFHRLTFLLIKLFTSVTILLCMLLPTTIYRTEVTTDDGNYSMAFDSVAFSARHHFCQIPEAKGLSVNWYETSAALNLPVGTQISDGLMKFGECRAKLLKAKKDLSLCSCIGGGYGLLIVASCIFAVVQLIHIFCGSWKKKFQEGCYFVFCLCACLWISSTVFATVYYVIDWQDEIWLPNSVYNQPYFQRPRKWSVALGMCYLFLLLSIAEIILLCCQECRLEKSDEVQTQPKTEKHQSQSENVSNPFPEESEQNAAIDDIIEDAYSQRSQSEIEPTVFEPLPNPKRANFQTVPEKPAFSASWP